MRIFQRWQTQSSFTAMSVWAEPASTPFIFRTLLKQSLSKCCRPTRPGQRREKSRFAAFDVLVPCFSLSCNSSRYACRVTIWFNYFKLRDHKVLFTWILDKVIWFICTLRLRPFVQIIPKPFFWELRHERTSLNPRTQSSMFIHVLLFSDFFLKDH